MGRLLCFSYFFCTYIVFIHAQILYECNFDNLLVPSNCFTRGTTVSASAGKVSDKIPSVPLSDVTSSLKPTKNGQTCKLPYTIAPYKWDMYFCNNGYCPTQNNHNTSCSPGRFASFNMIVNEKIPLTLKTASNGINGINEQCLIYYYYIPSTGDAKHRITVRKSEVTGENVTLDVVTSSPLNGWIERRISFNSMKAGYNVTFDVERTAGALFALSILAIDDILIRQGVCSNETSTPSTKPVTTSTTTIAQTETVTNERETLSTSTPIITTIEKTTTIDLAVSTISSITSTSQESSLATSPVAETTASSTLTTIKTTTFTAALTTYYTFTSMTTTVVQGITNTLTTSSTSTSTLSVVTAITASITTAKQETTARPFPTTTTVIGKENDKGSSNKILIIALATAIPSLFIIAAVGIGIWKKKSAAGGALGSAARPFMNIDQHNESSTLVELDRISRESSF